MVVYSLLYNRNCQKLVVIGGLLVKKLEYFRTRFDFYLILSNKFCIFFIDYQVRVQAIRGLPLFCKDTPEHLSKIVDILGPLLVAGKFCAQCLVDLVGSYHLLILIQFIPIMSGENVERDAVHKALMTLLRQDVKSEFLLLKFSIKSALPETIEVQEFHGQ